MERHSHPAQFHRPDVITDPLYVITPIFNPVRYRSRWKHYKNFEKHVLDSGAHLVTIEACFGERAEVLTESVHAHHTVIHVRTHHELWLKENLINIAISRLPHNWKYLAWIDADITFIRPDWVGECLQLLQHYDVIQMFSEAHDMNHDCEVIKVYKSFMQCYMEERKHMPDLGGDYCKQKPNGKNYWHPGFAWAATRKAIDALGGLIDWSILGGGDTFMAYALVDLLNNRTMPRSLGESGVQWLKQWQHRANAHVRKNVGVMKGTILHHWHGSRESRGYLDRGTILTKAHFNPEIDLKKDWQGLWQLTERSSSLRDDIRDYFRRRNEDSI